MYLMQVAVFKQKLNCKTVNYKLFSLSTLYEPKQHFLCRI